MKTRESGMPDEQMWDEFFNPDAILDGLGIRGLVGNIVDFGCGYGTFTIPAARKNQGMVYALDIDVEMIRAVQKKAKKAGVKNVIAVQRDFMETGTGLPNNGCECIMLFNILHAEDPLKILTEASRILVPGGKVGVIHWNYDITTPRGPSLSIRPRTEQCQVWLRQAGFELVKPNVDLPPYHYGILGQKP